MKVTWLGQSGYLFELNEERLLIDPFFSDVVFKKQQVKRMVGPPCSLESLRPDYLFITHDHLDHFDPETVMELHDRFPDAMICGPVSVIGHALKLGINPDVLVTITAAPVSFGSYTLMATSAYHSDPYAVGCILQAHEKTLYISGDTVFTPSLSAEIKAVAGGKIDMVFVVINGKLGNMNVAEAIKLVKELEPDYAIPMHYGMFLENTADPSLFTDGLINTAITGLALTIGESNIL